MRRNQAYLANEHLRKALDVLSKDNMKKLLIYLDKALSVRSKVRTNNHVERCNRVLRYLEKSVTNGGVDEQSSATSLLQFANWTKRKENQAAMAA